MSKKQKSAAARLRCQTMGLDPDEMLERPGLPKMPRWVAVLKEMKNEKEPEVGVMPQPEAYQDHTLTVVGNHEDQTIAQMNECMKVGNVVAGAICADGHLGYAQPVGGVIGYENQISISGVGFDIACGNMAVKLATTYGEIKHRLPSILGHITSAISFGVGRSNSERVDAELFDNADLWFASDMNHMRQKARAQLGTVGSGNHYVDVFVERPSSLHPEMTMDDCFIWIGVHFGSRGLGHTIATHYLKAAGGKDGINVPPAVVDVSTEIGERYLSGMTLAGQYAYAGREWVVERVRNIIGGEVLKTVHNHHNYAWPEIHNGRLLYVVRKGATPAFPGQEGFVGGSMGDDAVIIEGVDSQKSRDLLYSTVHGAGRVMGRRAALKTFTRQQMTDWLAREGVMLAGADLDESPMAYRRLSEVLADHDETVKINHVLKPIAVAMAGSDTFDPYKD